MITIIKRNGEQEKFKVSKIKEAVKKCASASGINVSDYVESMMSRFPYDINSDILLEVEKIQDWVISDMRQYLSEDLANEYSNYREMHSKIRDSKYNKRFYNTIMELVTGKDNDTSQENANKNAKQNNVIRDLMAGETSKKLYREMILSDKIKEYHDKGLLHLHDMDYRIVPSIINCQLINLLDILENGTVINDKLIESPKTLKTAATIATQVSLAVANSSYGGQTISLAHLAPWVRKSREKYESIIRNNDMTSKLDPAEFDAIIDTLLNQEIKDSIQTLNYQWNSFVSTNGQAPFVSVWMQVTELKGYEEETAMLIEEMLRQRIKGMKAPNGQWINPTFPKLLFGLEEATMNPESDYFYLSQLAAECTAKRMVPDYISIPVMKKVKQGCITPPMGCVDGDEVIVYKIKDKLFVESIKRAWERLAISHSTQPNGTDFYKDLQDVTIYDSNANKFIKCFRIIKNTDKHNWVRVKTSNGRLLTCTSDHPLHVVGKGRTFVKDIKVGDEILGTWKTFQGLEKNDYEKAWCQAVTICDGNYTYPQIKATFALDSENDIIDRYVKYFENNGIEMSVIERHRGQKGDYKEVFFTATKESLEKRKDFISKFTEGFGGINKIDRKIPSYIFNSDVETRKHFLGGLIDADGYVHHQKGHYTQIELGSTNKELALEQLLLINSLNYRGKIIENHYTKKDPNKIRWQVSFRADKDILQYITCKKKVNKYVEYAEKTKSDSFIVTDITHLETTDKFSYDVTTESDMFDVSGIISHNCRSMLTPYFDENNKPKVWGRANLGVISLNIPYVALESKTKEEFFNKLSEYAETICQEQYKIAERVADSPVERAPILWQYGVLARLPQGSKIGDLIRTHKGYMTISLGYTGIAEAVYRFGIEYVSEEGHEFAEKILKTLKKVTDAWASKTPYAFSLYGTPSESLTTKFAKALKRFKKIPKVNDHDYVTNSFHVPVTYQINAYDKISFESSLQGLTSGGVIMYIEAPDVRNNPQAVFNIMKYIYNNALYCEVNTTSCDVCYNCGYKGEIEMLDHMHFKCPKCGNTDKDKLYVCRRMCGYLGSLSTGTTLGRWKDIQDRVKHI